MTATTPTTAPTTAPRDEDEHVLNAAGEFEVHDHVVDLSVYGFEDWVSFGFFWILALVIFYQFFTRYALNDSASWTEEIARYLLICVTWVGAAIATRKNNHVQVDFFYRLLPAPLMRVMSTLVDAVRIAFLGYACVLTVELMRKIGGQPMAIIDWPIGLVYGVVLFGFALMTFRAVQVAILNWRRKASVLEKPELMDLPG
jgi:TRAP-type C4-dicarboxylate transport system permease small subunit